MDHPHSTLPGPACTILAQETYDCYGYWPHDLVPGSHRRILVVCPACKQQRSIPRARYRPDLLCLACHARKTLQSIPEGKRHHGNPTHGGYGTPEHNSWECMKSRCYYREDKDYANYGGKGITVCDAWRTSFARFLADIGLKPSPQHTLDRVDSTKSYEPGNVRWATPLEQANNKRNNRLITFQGQTLTIPQWARALHINTTTISQRLDRGWTVEQALGFSVRPPYRHTEATKRKMSQIARRKQVEKL